jgi:uncharacterized protein YbjT (DUF2867 family)
MTGYRAIVLGATGAVGSNVVRALLASPRCASVTILVRTPTDRFAALEGAAKLSSKTVKMEDLEPEARAAAANDGVAFCTLGVGQPSKVSKEEHVRVDLEYASAFARGCRAAGVRHMSLLTSVGANAESAVRYTRVKGQVETAYRSLDFPRVSFFRPSLLQTKEIRYGLQDRVTQAVFPALSWMLPRRFHEISVEDLGLAMVRNAERSAGGAVEVLEYADFVRVLQTPGRYGASQP